MGVDTSIDVYGVREALKELGAMDKKYRFQATAKIKAAGAGMIDAARKPYPDTTDLESNLRGWTKGGRAGYDKTKVDKGVQIQVGGKSYGNAWSVVTLIQKDSSGAMFDIAGLANGNSGKPGGPDRLGRKRQPVQSEAFLQALQNAYGRAQRGLWRARKAIFKEAEGALMEALRDVAAQVNKNLVES